MERLDSYIFEKSSDIRLNKLVVAKLDTKDSLSIHILYNRGQELTHLYSLFLDAMKSLASSLKNDERLKEVEEITATSWIVTEYPGIVEGLGFKLTDAPPSVAKRQIYRNARNTPYRTAKITKQDFLNKYSL